MGMLIGPFAVVGELFLLAEGGAAAAHAALVALLVTAIGLHGSGARFIVDHAERVIHTPKDGGIPASQIIGFDIGATVKVNESGDDLWGHLVAVLRNGERVEIAQDRLPERLADYGAELAVGFDVRWLPAEAES